MLLFERPHPSWEGVQKVYRFDNGFGASVIRAGDSSLGSFCGSYGANKGLWELGVIVFNSDDPEDFLLTYQTPITDDVLGYLTEKAVENVLSEIEALPPAVAVGV